MSEGIKPKFVVPKSKFQVGQRVLVRCVEIEIGPFEAVVCGVDFRPHRSQEFTYAVVEDSGMVSDEYTDKWLTAIPTPPNPQPSPLEKMAEEVRYALTQVPLENITYACDLHAAENKIIVAALQSAVASSEAEIERLKFDREVRAEKTAEAAVERFVEVLVGTLDSRNVDIGDEWEPDAPLMIAKAVADMVDGLNTQLQSARHQIEVLQSEIRTMRGAL